MCVWVCISVCACVYPAHSTSHCAYVYLRVCHRLLVTVHVMWHRLLVNLHWCLCFWHRLLVTVCVCLCLWHRLLVTVCACLAQTTGHYVHVYLCAWHRLLITVRGPGTSCWSLCVHVCVHVFVYFWLWHRLLITPVLVSVGVSGTMLPL